MTRLATSIAITLAAAAVLAATGSSRGATTITFTCPKNAAAGPSTLWVRNYEGFRGSTWCNDGATAKVTFSADIKGAKIPGSVTFTGGLCTELKNGSRYLQIGTRISPSDKRKPRDPRGLFLNKPTTNTGGDKWLDFGTPTFRWAAKVTISWTGNSGTYTGKTGLWLDNVYTMVRATGFFTCKRIVKTAR